MVGSVVVVGVVVVVRVVVVVEMVLEATMTRVESDVARVDPDLLLAVTATRIAEPTSSGRSE